MNSSANQFLGRLISSDDIDSLEECFAFLMSELSDEAVQNNKTAAVFNELWNWYCGGTENGVWQYYEHCSRDRLKQTSAVLFHFGCEQLSKAYLRGAEVLFPLLDGAQTEETSEKINQFSCKLDSYIDEYRYEILTAVKGYLVQNFEEIGEVITDSITPQTDLSADAQFGLLSCDEMLKQMEDEMFEDMGITREEALETIQKMRTENYYAAHDGKYSEEIAKEAEKYLKNAVFAAFDKNAKIYNGCSKVGGSPDVPKGFKWFTNSFGTPLTFLMQINFAELRKFDSDKIFPDCGILYFFYDVETQPWVWAEGDYKVFYYNGDVSQLSPMAFPDECRDSFYCGYADENCVIDECRLTFFADKSLPCYDEFTALSGYECEPSEYEATAAKMLGYEPMLYTDKYNIIGGYSIPEQNSVSEEFDSGYIQLLQMTYYESDKCGFMFGDGGKLYFYINKDELADGNFDNVKFVLQCG